MTDLNPQARQMADESMIRNLEAQALAIWPQEVELIRRYSLPPQISILDAGCGTGEVSSRLAESFPEAQVLGIDIIDHHLELARARYRHLGSRLRFEHRNLFELDLADDSFDLTVCRHVVHSIPHPERVYAELARVTRRGGRLHLIPEDYGMIHFRRGGREPDDFLREATIRYSADTDTDLFIGRHTFEILAHLGLREITIDYVIVDPLRVPRETFAAILEAWRDGYAETISEHTRYTADEAEACFNAMIDNVRDPDGYAVWMVPVVGVRIP